MAGLAFEGVAKHYGHVRALDGLDLEIADGELMVIVGPSGSGKTTALRAAAGLEEVTAGRIRIGDRDVTSVPAARRNVSMVFQSYALFPHLSVAENIGFGLVARRVPRTAVAERVRSCAALVGCEDLLDRKPSQLSGGERQRVALARALAREPDVYLLDEPLSNLDAQLRVTTRAELEALHQRLGITMLYVTHDQVEALTMGDRVAVMRGGALQQLGTPDDVYRRPANRFVAGFIGSPAMNFLPAEPGPDGLRAGPLAVEVELPDGSGRGSLEIGIRPDDVRVSFEGGGAPAEVQVVEAAGRETYLHLDLAGRRVIARVAPEVRPELGSLVHVSAPGSRVYVFDAGSGETLVQAR